MNPRPIQSIIACEVEPVLSGDDPFIQELEAAVADARKDREWRHEYMTLQLRDQENREIGREEGRIEGRVESLNNLLKFNPRLSVDAGAEMLGFSREELEGYKELMGRK